jgi:hypothetical protein
MDEEWARKPMRARLLPGKDNAIQRLTDCMGRDGVISKRRDRVRNPRIDAAMRVG